MPYKNPADRVAYMARYYKEHPKQFLAYSRKCWAKNPERAREWNRKSKANIQAEIFAAYGNKCSCCGDTHKEFFTVDHIQGGGGKHRKSLGGSSSFYYWLRREGYPRDRFRLLCINCNFSIGMHGYCPHQRIPIISFD